MPDTARKHMKRFALNNLDDDGLLTCNICGVKGVMGNEHTEMSIHHILPQYIYRNNNPDNMVVLCNKCHRYVENMYKNNKKLLTLHKLKSDVSVPRTKQCDINDTLRKTIQTHLDVLAIPYSSIFPYVLINMEGFRTFFRENIVLQNEFVVSYIRAFKGIKTKIDNGKWLQT